MPKIVITPLKIFTLVYYYKYNYLIPILENTINQLKNILLTDETIWFSFKVHLDFYLVFGRVFTPSPP